MLSGARRRKRSALGEEPPHGRLVDALVAWGDVDALRAAVDGSVAAVLIEPIQGEGGVNVAPEGYLAAIRRICDEVGALLIVDEIQTGFARTGRWFGFEHDDVVPASVVQRYVATRGDDEPLHTAVARGADHFDVIDPDHPAYLLLLAEVEELTIH